MNGNQLLVSQVWLWLGPIIGLIAGHLLTRSREHKQWLRENRKQEFRELLSALGKIRAHMLDMEVAMQCESLKSKLHWDSLDAEHKNAFCVITDRIYIAQDLDKLNAGIRFSLTGYSEERLRDSNLEIAKLMRDIVAVAQEG